MSDSSVPAYLPIFSAVIALSAFSAILGSFLYHRRNATGVEEANFEFYHLTIQGLNYRQQEPVSIKMVAHKAKRFIGFWRARAYQKMKDFLWRTEPRSDENEMEDVTEQLLTTKISYNTTGITIANS